LTSAERVAVTNTAVLKTRPGKTHDHPASLHENWIAEAAGAGYGAADVIGAARAAAAARQQAPTMDERAVLVEAVRAAATTRATFSRADLLGQVAARLPVEGLDAAATVARIEALTNQALVLEEAVSVGRHPQRVTARASDSRWAGAQVLAAEERILSLAQRGRGGGYGRAWASTTIVRADAAGLDGSQTDAAIQIATAGDFLSVLTAPACAGKTRTLGAVTAAWRADGYRVIGLAPSARAGAELATATGGHADTLAKWLHDHDRRGILMPDQRARTILDHRTVVILDEASMANTLHLDTLITAAARKAAKVVLVGDPAQIGVVNGPGGMLAALARHGHGVELTGVHRFDEDWERQASLVLRSGNPDVLTYYRMHERLHPCLGPDQAISAVHAHWATENAAGREVLMLARTRTDVDALNLAARSGEQAAGEITGPVIRIGERDWQTGDLLRTRRNDRRLTVGDGHVRNGDRWHVITADDNGLLVEDVGGRGRTRLPAEYVAAHAEYGWAATIDAAQGATVDVGILLARPGLDRERLYVAMTRGRQENHTYITLEPTTETDHHAPPAPATRPGNLRTVDEHAMDVLRAAIAKTGAQDAAHTAHANARHRTVQEAQAAAERTASAEARRAAIVPPEHAARAEQLTRLHNDRRAIDEQRRHHTEQADTARTELAGTSRWHRHRRTQLQDTIRHHRTAHDRTFPEADRLDREINTLTRQVQADTRQHEQDQHNRATQATHSAARPTQAYLAPVPDDTLARAARLGLEPTAGSRRQQDLERAAERSRRHAHDQARDRARGRDRDDGRSLGI
jgi:hypothetical protein